MAALRHPPTFLTSKEGRRTIEYGRRVRKLPAPPRMVWESLTQPHARGTRPWLRLLTPGDLPDESKTGGIGRRMGVLLFADLGYSYGQ
ncbi:MAG: hypothetical protein FWE71_14735 [Nocardioidaceae bacterium]|nr:hypothetical protein [Nocardioidaceae bacterium]MCL2614805.1 hypothetical protein [Nocardioidaceae bacterium]